MVGKTFELCLSSLFEPHSPAGTGELPLHGVFGALRMPSCENAEFNPLRTVESKHQGLVKVPISGFCFSFSSKRYDSRVRHFRSQPLEASAEDLKCCFALESLEPCALAAWRPFGTNSHHECVEGRELQGFVLMGTCQNVGPVRNCQKN